MTVYLLDASGSRLATAVTDANGEYRFTGLAPGLYGVEEVQPEGYYDGIDRVGSAGGTLVAPDTIKEIRLVSGTAGVNYDFYELPPVSLSGFVYVDENNNGIRNAEKRALPVVLHCSGPRPSAYGPTDANGLQVRRPGAGQGVRVAEAQPTGYLDGPCRHGRRHGPTTRVT